MADCVVTGQAVTGSLSPAGLRIAGRVTEVLIDAVSWTPLPAIPLENRNAMLIQNFSGTEAKINYDPNIVGYVGVFLLNNMERAYDISDDIVIYAKASSGTLTLVVEELS